MVILTQPRQPPHAVGEIGEVAIIELVVDGRLSPYQLLLVVLAIDGERAYRHDRHAEPRLAKRQGSLQLHHEERLAGATRSVKAGRIAYRDPIRHDPSPLRDHLPLVDAWIDDAQRSGRRLLSTVRP